MTQDTNNIADISVTRLNDQKAQFNLLYARCFGEISSMLKKARVMPMIELANHNPSFKHMASELKGFIVLVKQLSAILELSPDFTHLDECIELIESLANSIESQCQDSLGTAVAALNDKPYI